MSIILGILGMIAGIVIIKYRESIGDLFGSADWMRYLGGPYMIAVIIGVLLFFFSFAKITGTTDIFLSPLTLLFPFMRSAAPTDGF